MKVLEFLMLYILSRLIYNVSEKEGRDRKRGKGRSRMAVHGKHTKWGDRWGAPSIHPPARARDAGETPQSQLSGHPSLCQAQEQVSIPTEKWGTIGTKPLNHQLALNFSFFSLNCCISSHSAHTPPPVFSFRRVAGLFTCWRSSLFLQVYFK